MLIKIINNFKDIAEILRIIDNRMSRDKNVYYELN
jgi:hypothetical protein